MPPDAVPPQLANLSWLRPSQVDVGGPDDPKPVLLLADGGLRPFLTAQAPQPQGLRFGPTTVPLPATLPGEAPGDDVPMSARASGGKPRPAIAIQRESKAGKARESMASSMNSRGDFRPAGRAASWRDLGDLTSERTSLSKVADPLARQCMRIQRPPPPATTTVQQCVARFVLSKYFDFAMCIILILNGLSIGVQADISGRNNGNVHHDTAGVFEILEYVFAVVFLVELSLRIFVWRPYAFFLGADAVWNWFDTITVALQFVEGIVSLTMPAESREGTDTVANNLRTLKMLRFMKLLRVVRILRIVRFIQELSNVLYLIMGSLASFLWTFFLLMLLVYVMSVFFTQLVADFADYQPPEVASTLRRYFGSLGAAVLATFQAVSGGIDWRDLTDPLMEISPLLAVLFFGFIAFAVLVMLNLVTGVFVDGAQRLREKDVQRSLVKGLHTIFREATGDIGEERGLYGWQSDFAEVITREDFRRGISTPEMQQLFDLLHIDAAEGEVLYRLLDRKGGGSLSCEHFVQGGLRLQGPARAIDLAKFHLQLAEEMKGLTGKVQEVVSLLPRHMRNGMKEPSSRDSYNPFEGDIEDVH